MKMDFLIPPRRIRNFSGNFQWPKSVVLASPAHADQLPLEQLAVDLKAAGVKARVARSTFGPGVVRIRRGALDIGPAVTRHEAYRLSVTPDGVEITAYHDAGAYYAIQTLRELMRTCGKTLPLCAIEDWPDFARRGVYLDCSRGKVPTLETVKDLVVRLAAWKINEFQLYVENVFSYKRHPLIGRGYSPFTAEEILELQDHCREYHVQLVGSLASFGHMERILEIPAYRHLGETNATGGKVGGVGMRSAGTTLCPTDPASIKFMDELYEEFIPLHEARDFNICGDETYDLGKGRSKARADKAGVGRLYLDFLLKLNKLVQKHGKRTNAWSDIVLQHPELLKDMPRDIVMLNWGYNIDCPRMARSGEIAAAGLPLVVCPGTSSWQTHGTRLHNALVNIRQSAWQGRKHQAEGLLNTDWGDGGHRNTLGVSLLSYAYGAAQSWNGEATSEDDRGFARTFCRQAFAQTSNTLADALVSLGDSYRVVSGQYGNHCALYRTLVEPVGLPEETYARGANDCKPAGLRKVIANFGSLRWPSAGKLPEFESLALAEFELAARMDVVAARRALAVLDLRAGKKLPAPLVTSLAADMKILALDFAKLWLARSKPSRLADNLRLMEKAWLDIQQ